jgi:probable HAF family extracellular repeat protein
MTVRHSVATIVFAVAVTCGANPVLAQIARAYVVEELPSFGGGDLVGLSINNHGDIAGYGYRTDGSIRAFRWTQAGGLEDLGANGGWLSQAIGINDNGDVVGVYLDANNNPHGFIAPVGGLMRDLRTSDRQIVRVNSITNDGQMTGMLYSYTPSFQVHAFRTLGDGTLQDLGNTVYTSVGWHINDAGQVTGYEASTEDANTQAAFRFSDTDGKVTLGTLGGARSSGMSINNSGVVVGWSEGADSQIYSRAFRARPGFPIEDLGTLGGSVAGAEAVNDSGAVVGWSAGRAFIYSDTDGMIDLNTRVPAAANCPLYDAMGVNNAGQIVVLCWTNGHTGTVRLTPIVDTEPPVITNASVTPDVLMPPDGHMVPVSVSVSAIDNLDPAPVCTITNVTNSEAPTSGSDPDVQILDQFNLLLRADRLGTGIGRTYTITVGCHDLSANTATRQLTVSVPHDSGKDDPLEFR